LGINKINFQEEQMAKKKDRDIEKAYSTKQMVAKLRRLADCLETGKQFKIQSQAKKYPFQQKHYSTSNTKAKATPKKLNSKSSGNDDLMHRNQSGGIWIMNGDIHYISEIFTDS